MAQPPPYNRQANFRDIQASDPASPLPGDKHDNELNAIKTTLDATLANLKVIQRDDGKLANNSVGPDQLASEFFVGFQVPQPWAAATVYEVGDQVYYLASRQYRCLIAHTSTTDFDTDLANGNWLLIVDYGDAVSQAQTYRDEARAAAQDSLGHSQTSLTYSQTSASHAGAAASSATDALNHSTKSSEWADKAVDEEVEAGRFSARHWAQKAADTAASLDPDRFLSALVKPKVSIVGSSTVFDLDINSKVIIVEAAAGGGGGGASTDQAIGGASNPTAGGPTTAVVALTGATGGTLTANAAAATISRNNAHINNAPTLATPGSGDATLQSGGGYGGGPGGYRLNFAHYGGEGGLTRSSFVNTGTVTCTIGAGGAPGVGSGWQAGRSGGAGWVVITEFY